MSEEEVKKTPDGIGAETETPQSDPAIVARALEMGWQALEHFRGDPDKFVSAEDFVRRGEELMPILKQNNRKLQAEIRDIKATLREFADHHKRVKETEYNRALETIRAQQAQAVATGDGKAYAELDKLREQVTEQRIRQNAQQAAPADNREFNEWRQQPENKWYGQDTELTDVADTIGVGLRARFPNMPLDEILERTSSEIKRLMPHKFGSKRQSPSAVEGGGRPANTGARSYNALPSEAKAACDRFIKQGLVKDRAEYLKEYEWE